MTELEVCGNVNENLITKASDINDDNFQLYTIEATQNGNSESFSGSHHYSGVENNFRVPGRETFDMEKNENEDFENRNDPLNIRAASEVHTDVEDQIMEKQVDDLPVSATFLDRLESDAKSPEHFGEDLQTADAIPGYLNGDEGAEEFPQSRDSSTYSSVSHDSQEERQLLNSVSDDEETKINPSGESSHKSNDEIMFGEYTNEKHNIPDSTTHHLSAENVQQNDSANLEDTDDEELDNVTEFSRTRDYLDRRTIMSSSEFMMDHPSGLRGKANTPVSHYTGTEFTEDLRPPSPDSRSRSRLGSDARDVVYKQAMDLISMRCGSFSQTPVDRMKDNQQFYVQQEKPVPMPPLKVWRGYHGNVYFEPIHVVKVNDALKKNLALDSRPKTSKLNQTFISSNKSERPFSRRANSGFMRSKSGMSIKAPFVLDKRSVLEKFDDNIEDDIKAIEGTLSTGSLCVKPKSVKDNSSRNKTVVKNRIHKGSVAHRVYVTNKEKAKTFLTVTGDKFSPPSSTSPLLRTQTQYSLSTQRTMMNSPDYGFDHRLPPLEQFRNSLKHYDSAHEPYRGFPFGRSTTWTEDYKPYIKYSPEVKAKFDRQQHYV